MRAPLKRTIIILDPYQLAYAFTMTILVSSGINCITGAVICSQLLLAPQWICGAVMLAGFGLLLGAVELRRRLSNYMNRRRLEDAR